MELFSPLPYIGACVVFVVVGGGGGGDMVVPRWGCNVDVDDHGLAVADADGVVAADDQFTEVEEAGGFVDGGGKADCAVAAGWRGWENCVVEGVMAGRFARSGVTVLNEPCWALKPPSEAGATVVVGLGVDQENVAFCAALGFFNPGDPTEDREAASSQLGAASNGLLLLSFELDLPLTSFSKSSSVAPVAASNCVPEIPPKDIKSSAGPAAEPLVVPESSWSFLVCSSSTLRERALINSMKVWNCFRLSSGPRLMFQRIGKMSIAINSVSA